MAWVWHLILGCVALALLQAASSVLLILLALALLWGLFHRPAELFGCAILLLLMSLLQQHPIALLTLIGFLGFIALVRRPVHGRGKGPEGRALLLPSRTSEVPRQVEGSD